MILNVKPKILGPLAGILCGAGTIFIVFSIHDNNIFNIFTFSGIIMTLIGSFLVGITISLAKKDGNNT